MADRLLVYVPPHPLVKHWLAVARDVTTPPSLFRTAMKELGHWLTYEAVREWLPTLETTVQTPLTSCAATTIDPEVPIAIVPILRAGLALLEGAQTVLPLASIYHLGVERDEQSLQPRCYLNRFPEQFPARSQIVVAEPMLATGGTIELTMKELTQRGVDPSLVRIVSIVAAPQALQKLDQSYSSLQVYTACIDEGLNDRGFIVPGLGDAGDRSFGTTAVDSPSDSEAG